VDELNIELDFEGINAAGGLGTLPAGLHVGKIAEFRHFPDTNRLYVYMLTGGIRHRESFGLDNPNSLPFLKAFLLSAGVPEKNVSGKGKVPFHKLAGRNAYFQYTPADTNSDGSRVEGSYARYVFYQKAQWDQMFAYSDAAESDVVVEAAPANNGTAEQTVSKEAPAPAAKSGGDDFDFLLDDDA
jgi:hypothetical protein|tara:strand:- start:9064 stop:9618 length:555 start_codon:yes stop_codon:yes gene_type:complete